MKRDIPNPADGAGEVAVVTGGAIRVGRAISRRLAADGYAVLVHHFRSEAEARTLAGEIVAAGGRADAVALDLTVPGAAARLIGEAVRRFGRLDLLVNSAALFADDGAPLAELARMKVLNADVPAALLDAAAPHLGKVGGSVVNIADVAGIVPFRGRRAYSAAKKSVLALTAIRALELAGSGVRVNAVCPGAVLFPEWYPEELRRRVTGGVPLGRVGSPEDVADAVAYLARARFVTGQVLSVDGGRLLSLLERGAGSDDDLEPPARGRDVN